MNINISLPDGKVIKAQQGTCALEIAKTISEGLARNILSASVNNEVWDINRPINQDCSLKLHTFNDIEGKWAFFSSFNGQLEYLYPGIKLGIGPAIDNGFYYDVDLGDDRKISQMIFLKLKKNAFSYRKNSFNRKELINKRQYIILNKKVMNIKLNFLMI